LSRLCVNRCVDQLDGFDITPVVVLRREVDADNVAGEPDTAFAAPLVDADTRDLLGVGGVVAEDLGDPSGGVVLFGDDHCGAATHWCGVGWWIA